MKNNEKWNRRRQRKTIEKKEFAESCKPMRFIPSEQYFRGWRFSEEDPTKLERTGCDCMRRDGGKKAVNAYVKQLKTAA